MYKGVGKKPEELKAFIGNPNEEIEKKRAFVEWKKMFESTTTKCIFGDKYLSPNVLFLLPTTFGDETDFVAYTALPKPW